MKKISVIVPCYNVEKYIDRCINSLVNQTIGLENLELIFVDDASKDGTLDKLFDWEQKYSENIMVIPCKENRRQGAARNIGMQYATGAYIGFVDSDDYVSEEMYDTLYQIAEQETCDAVSCLFVREYEDGSVAMPAEPHKNAGKKIEIKTVEDRRKYMRSGMPGGIWSKIYRRELILEHDLYFPEELTYEDNYWSAFLGMELSSYYILNQPMYHYVVNEQSTIMQQNASHHLDRLVIELMKVEEYQRRNLFETFHAEIEFSFLRMYFINSIRILFVRFQEIPYDIIYTMQENVRELFPDYHNNPYLDELPQLQRELLKIVDVPLDRQKIDILANAYRKVLQDSL